MEMDINVKLTLLTLRLFHTLRREKFMPAFVQCVQQVMRLYAMLMGY